MAVVAVVTVVAVVAVVAVVEIVIQKKISTQLSLLHLYIELHQKNSVPNFMLLRQDVSL